MSSFTSLFGKGSDGKSYKHQLKISALLFASVMIVISLAWSNAITALIDYYIPQKYAKSSNAWFKVLYALILTLIVIGSIDFIYGM